MFPPLRLRAALSFGGLSPREFAVRTWTKVIDNEIMTRAAAVSFYAMAALVPIIALLLTILIQLLPNLSAVAGQSRGIGNLTVAEFQTTINQVFPKEAAKVVEEQIKRVQDDPPFGLLSIGVLIALWTASSLYVAIMDSMNRVYGVVETRSLIRIRIVALLMCIIQATILLAALIAVVAGPEILDHLGVRGSSGYVAIALQWFLIFFVVLFSFALTFYIGPDADTKWEWITPGSFIGTGVFLGFTFLFRIYIQNFANYDKTYGSLGGVMVLLLWFWVSSLVLLTAGQMNKVIEEASPLGKNFGQKVDTMAPPDFTQMKPETAS